MPRGSRPEAQQGDGVGNTNSPETMDKPQEGQPDLRDLLLFVQQAQRVASRWREEDARRRDEETRHREEDARHRDEETRCREEDARRRDEETRRWREEDARRRDEETRRREEDARRRDEETRHREEDAKRQAAWMEQMVSKLARGRVQEEPQPARGEAPASESMVEGGTTDRRSTTTILEREETGSQADSRSGDCPDQPLGQPGSPTRISRAPSAQLQPNPPDLRPRWMTISHQGPRTSADPEQFAPYDGPAGLRGAVDLLGHHPGLPGHHGQHKPPMPRQNNPQWTEGPQAWELRGNSDHQGELPFTGRSWEATAYVDPQFDPYPGQGVQHSRLQLRTGEPPGPRWPSLKPQRGTTGMPSTVHLNAWHIVCNGHHWKG